MASNSLEALSRLLKPGEVVNVLSIGARKLWALTNAGEIKCVRIGRAVRYDPDDVREFLAARKGAGRD